MRRWLAWNVWFRLQERAKGHETFRILEEMEAADRLTPEQLEQLQQKRLVRFIESCYRDVPYVRRRMREVGVQPGDIRQVSDLRRLPVMTKAEIRQHRAELRSQRAKRLSQFATGGSTGEPLLFDLGKRRIASRVACRQRVARWWGVSLGDLEIALWGSPVELTRQDWLRRQRDKLLRTTLLSAFEMNPETMSRYLDVLERGRCTQIFAYPSAIYQLCLHARKIGRNLRGLGTRVVFVTSEVLYPFQRELITAVLNCPVANGYGGRDSGFIAHECPQGGMHIMADAVIVEVVDNAGRPLPAGQPGEILVTDFYSSDAPFLRYATGDIGVISQQRCACGRALPLLERIDGRANDIIVSVDGRIINDQALVYLLREIDGIEQFQICQKRVDWLHVDIVPANGFRSNSEERIRSGWTKLLRHPVEVTFGYKTSIPADPRGKFRHVVSEVGIGGALRGEVVNRSEAS